MLPIRLAVLIIVASSVACVSPPETIGAEADAIVGGSRTTAHPYVLGLCRGDTPNDCTETCTGTLIAPNLVLTVRHCVDTLTPALHDDGSVDCANSTLTADTTSKYWVTTSATMYPATKPWHGTAEVVKTKGSTYCGNDVALLILSESVPESEARPVAPRLDAIETSSIAAVGYGNTRRGETNWGFRRLRSNVPIECVPNDRTMPCAPKRDGLFSYENNPEDLSAADFLAGAGICNGDSGGPAFDQARLDDGTPLIVGLAARVGRTTQQCTFSIYARVDSHRDLIVGAARRAARLGGYALPSWAAR